MKDGSIAALELRLKEAEEKEASAKQALSAAKTAAAAAREEAQHLRAELQETRDKPLIEEACEAYGVPSDCVLKATVKAGMVTILTVGGARVQYAPGLKVKPLHPIRVAGCNPALAGSVAPPEWPNGLSPTVRDLGLTMFGFCLRFRRMKEKEAREAALSYVMENYEQGPDQTWRANLKSR